MKILKNPRKEVKKQMCRCCCGAERHHPHYENRHDHGPMGFPQPIMDVDVGEEIKTLEEYKEALTKRLEMVNRQLEALKLKKVMEK
jgi:hypothetical protein